MGSHTYLKTKTDKYIFALRFIIAIFLCVALLLYQKNLLGKEKYLYSLCLLFFTAATLFPFNYASGKSAIAKIFAGRSFYDAIILSSLLVVFPTKITLIQIAFPLIIISLVPTNNLACATASSIILSLSTLSAFITTSLALPSISGFLLIWSSFIFLRLSALGYLDRENTIEMKDKEISRAFKLAEKVTTSIRLEDIIELVYDELKALINFENFSLHLVDEKKNKLKLFSTVLKNYSKEETKGLVGSELELDYNSAGGAAAAVLWQKDFYFENIDASTLPDGVNKESLITLKLKSVYLSPIVYHGKSIGVITLSSSKPSLDIDTKQINIIRRIVYQIAPFINNARLFSELELSKEFTEKIIETSPIGILTFDMQGIITKENPEIKSILLGKKHDSALNDTLIGKNIFSLVSEENSNLEEVFNKGLKGDMVLETGFHFKSSDNKNLILNLSLSPIKTNDILSGVLAMFSDNTQKATAEEHLKKRNEIIENDLMVAKKIQLNLLPSQSPKLDDFKFKELYIPMDKLGGDFFDYIEIDEDNLGILITDVSGHGVPAAFITSMIKTTIGFPYHILISPDLFLSKLKDALFPNLGNMYFTGFYIVLNKSKKTISYSNAGHIPPVVMRRSTEEIIELNVPGTIIGLVPYGEYEIGTLSLVSKDRIILFTDGLVEHFEGEVHDFEHMYGTERLEDFMRENMSLNTDDFIRGLFEDIDNFKNSVNYVDDISMVIVDVD